MLRPGRLEMLRVFEVAGLGSPSPVGKPILQLLPAQVGLRLELKHIFGTRVRVIAMVFEPGP